MPRIEKAGPWTLLICDDEREFVSKLDEYRALRESERAGFNYISPEDYEAMRLRRFFAVQRTGEAFRYFVDNGAGSSYLLCVVQESYQQDAQFYIRRLDSEGHNPFAGKGLPPA